MEVHVRNVNNAYVAGMEMLHVAGVIEESRNGPVIVYPEPVMTIYDAPMERVLFNEGRDANPFFHLMEAMWMLAGRRDLAFLTKFNGQMAKYSDDGKVLYGAYGWRWRHPGGKDIDQLDQIVHKLKQDLTSRRAVLTMWGAEDLFASSKDVPCNTHIYFRPREDYLDMTVCCRSNDIIWGAYGANSVHFSILQEYMAAGLGLGVGRMYQFSNNYHAYVELFEEKYPLSHDIPWLQYGIIQPTRIVKDYWHFLHELKEVLDIISGLCSHDNFQFHNPFMNALLYIAEAWRLHKDGKDQEALNHLEVIRDADDWRFACIQWIKRRMK